VRDELGVDAALPDATRDQLRVLTAEVDDEHRPLAVAGGQLDDSRLSDDSSGRPS
jgi:hypothetical protein